MKQYGGEKDRYRFIKDEFGQYIDTPIIDFGCRDNYLSQYYDNVIGIDCVDHDGTDYVFDLDDPDDRSTITQKMYCTHSAVASHILEHLQNPKFLLETIQSLEPQTIIIGLPNEINWMRMYHRIRGNLSDKWKVRPDMEDRHHWFFDLESAEAWTIHYLSEDYELVETRTPVFSMNDAGWKATLVNEMIKWLGTDTLKARDWWGVFRRRDQ